MHFKLLALIWVFVAPVTSAPMPPLWIRSPESIIPATNTAAPIPAPFSTSPSMLTDIPARRLKKAGEFEDPFGIKDPFGTKDLVELFGS